MPFENIKGHSEAIVFLEGAVKSGRLSHAYIFTGSAGIGKKLVAVSFAGALQCKGANLSLIAPDKEGGSISIDKMRDLMKNISLKPYEGTRNVFIIDDAGSLTQEASNALLKTLEEPPAGAVIILIAETTEELLPTIVSRAQVVRFSAFRPEELKDILIKDYSMDEVRAHILSYLSSGRLGEALKYDTEDFSQRRDSIIKGLKDGTFFDSDFEGVSRSRMKSYLDIALSWYRDILITKAGIVNEPQLFNIDRKEEVFREAGRMELGRLNNAIKEIISTASLIDQNANLKLAMSVLGIKTEN